MPASRRTRFLFIRHGETDWNRRPRFRGHVDVPLNRAGIRQAERAAARLARESIAAVYASPLGRTMRTAELVAGPHGLAVRVEPALIDMDFGTWHGRTPTQVRRSEPGRFRRWVAQPDRVRIPGGEDLAAVQARALTLLRTLRRRHRHRTVVLVSHDVVGRGLVCAALGAPLAALWRVPQGNAGISILEHDGRTLAAVTVNDVAHLEGVS